MKTLSITSIICAIATSFIYYLMNYTSLSHGFKWCLFSIHLIIAFLGIFFGVVGVFKKQWISILGIVICGYFLIIQLGGL